MATYLGTLPGRPHAFDLDLDTTFVTGKPRRVDSNVASALRQSRFAAHFSVSAPGEHRGPFVDASTTSDGLLAHLRLSDAVPAGDSSCCAGGSCSAPAPAAAAAASEEAKAAETAAAAGKSCCGGGAKATAAASTSCCGGGPCAPAADAKKSCCGGGKGSCC
mmetsp:Transcript_29905/g.97847  ORF Transcript_29905/g.97847 Transcript_29905/m.97847 type:complete len:162 (+) Transcript_29905:2-487(+)